MAAPTPKKDLPRIGGAGAHDWVDDGLKTYTHAKCHREACRD
jgi:hypothetical protein